MNILFFCQNNLIIPLIVSGLNAWKELTAVMKSLSYLLHKLFYNTLIFLRNTRTKPMSALRKLKQLKCRSRII